MAQLSILLCDGEHVLRRATAVMLTNRGANVREVETVDEALRWAATRIYDVAVFDVEEGGPTAEEIARVMRQRGCLPRRLVVCAPAPVNLRDAAACTKVLQKPYPFHDLLAAVFGLRGQRRPTRSGVFETVGARRNGLRARPHRRVSQRSRAWHATGVTVPRRAARVRRGRV